MPRTFGYISQGKLYLQRGDGKEVEVISDFVRDLKKRLQSVEDRQTFRGSGSGAQFLGRGMGAGGAPGVEDTFHSEFSCASSAEGRLCYAIDAQDVRALCDYEPVEKYERRLLHGPKHRFTTIATRQGEGEEGAEWLVAAAQDHGASRIGLFRPGAGGGVRELTEGDSLDSYPAWVPGDARAFVYQTSGIARHANSNHWVGLGPASLHRVDLDSGEMETLVEDARYDFLCPAFGPDGTLYYLRRPYEPFHTPSFWKFLQDVVLFPLRLLRAVFGFLNAFSMMFSGKPLQTAGTPPKPGVPDPKGVFLHGRWVNMEKAMREAAVDEITTVVPRNWQLVCHALNGEPEVVLDGVMAFAIDKEGQILYSNGTCVYCKADKSAKPEKIASRKLVTSIVALGQ